jgi:hypothetical protein
VDSRIALFIKSETFNTKTYRVVCDAVTVLSSWAVPFLHKTIMKSPITRDELSKHPKERFTSKNYVT